MTYVQIYPFTFINIFFILTKDPVVYADLCYSTMRGPTIFNYKNALSINLLLSQGPALLENTVLETIPS